MIPAIEAILTDMQDQGGGSFTIVLDEAGDWSAAYTFGREADDSPMAGGASYGYGATVDECVAMIAGECRLEVQ